MFSPCVCTQNLFVWNGPNTYYYHVVYRCTDRTSLSSVAFQAPSFTASAASSSVLTRHTLSSPRDAASCSSICSGVKVDPAVDGYGDVRMLYIRHHRAVGACTATAVRRKGRPYEERKNGCADQTRPPNRLPKTPNVVTQNV